MHQSRRQLISLPLPLVPLVRESFLAPPPAGIPSRDATKPLFNPENQPVTMILPRLTYRFKRSLLFVLSLLAITLPVGCQKQATSVAPEYARPLPTGTDALRRLTEAEIPNLSAAYLAQDQGLIEALERSLNWFEKPSTQQHFPIADVTHQRAWASVFAFDWILDLSNDPNQFMEWIREEFDVYSSVGWNGQGEVLFTGYYTPVFEASRTRTGIFRYPLYRRPENLVTERVTGRVLGRRVGDQISPYPTRRELRTSHALSGKELVWLHDPLDAYIIQVQGSARLTLTDGGTMQLGYDGSNGHEYTSIGKLLIRDGQIAANRLSLPAIRAFFHRNPDQLDRYVLQNDRFIFFQESESPNWPAGSLGLEVTSLRTLATDKQVFPRGGVSLVVTEVPTITGRRQHFGQFMLDQDTGGAIRAAGRADIYMGIGPDAEKRAGRQLAVGRLYYLFLKPDRVAPWLASMQQLSMRR